MGRSASTALSKGMSCKSKGQKGEKGGGRKGEKGSKGHCGGRKGEKGREQNGKGRARLLWFLRIPMTLYT